MAKPRPSIHNFNHKTLSPLIQNFNDNPLRQFLKTHFLMAKHQFLNVQFLMTKSHHFHNTSLHAALLTKVLKSSFYSLRKRKKKTLINLIYNNKLRLRIRIKDKDKG